MPGLSLPAGLWGTKADTAVSASVNICPGLPLSGCVLEPPRQLFKGYFKILMPEPFLIDLDGGEGTLAISVFKKAQVGPDQCGMVGSCLTS